MKLPVLSEEFPPGADALDGSNRRDFLKLLGGTLALAGACTCQPAEHAAPRAVEPLTVGGPLHYATCITLGGLGTPLLVTARDGRPVKIEGNPEHPLTLGASGPLEQAELLRLYDPQRAQQVLHDGQPSTLAAFTESAVERVRALSKKDGGRGVRFLTEPSSSPLLTGLKSRLLELLPNARFVTWSPLSTLNRLEGSKLAFGRPFEALYDFARARVIAAFDDDFLFPQGARLGPARAFAERRVPGPKMNRLYVVEPSPTVTGSLADHRLAVKGSEVEGVLRALVAAVAKSRPALQPLAAGAPRLDGAQGKLVSALARDLLSAGPEALVTVGDRQPPVAHALAHALSSELAALGSTVTLVTPALAEVSSGPGSLKALGDELELGQVDALVITTPNPAYCTYGNVDLSGLLKRCKSVIYLGAYDDETAAVAQWFVPRVHPLESWGDARALDGSALLQQPLVEPFYKDALSEAQLYAALVGESEKRPFALLRSSWARRHGAADDAAFARTFERWVQAGVVPGSAFPSESAAIDLHAIAHAPRAGLSPGLELAFARDAKLHDGRFANTPWLQELPDPVTQLVWDNAALMSPATAAKLGLTGPTQGQPGPPGVKACARVKLSVTGRGLNASVTAPVLVLPGHADDCITLPLGYGHTGSGERVAQSVGFSAYVLRHSDAPYFSPVEASRVDGTHLLVTTQQHWALDGNPPARQLTLAELAKEKPGARAAPQGPEHQWGMAIDLSRCSGCSACVTACQAENNLPVVGREAVAQGREMFWMRVDRYATEGGTSISQPVACQHCADAPCERACPVSATSHTPEGLNVMAYGRCVGSRACGTACPYKVRRFNYLDLNQSLTPLERMRANPEVPLRAKGVMEKCTFCAQRIERAKRELPRLTDGAVRTACQQACPTQAIAFGDLNDAASQVSRWHQDPRRYALLSETGMKPRNLYLARVKNPNPELQ